MRSGSSSLARASASAITSLPSASVLSTSTVLPPYMVRTSDGLWALPLGMFSARAPYAVTATFGASFAIATTAVRTAAAPLMSHFIVTIASFGLSDKPPESKVMPLPTKAMCLVARAGL
jgi:hypothetical protein